MDRFSVVVLTHNRRNELLRTLAMLRALPEQPSVYCVDNGSSDGTAAAVAADFPEVHLIRLQRNIGAAGRNIGVHATHTPYVAFCDDDTWWAPGSLAQTADVMDRFPRVAAITARVLVGPAEREDPACTRMAHSPLPNEPGLPGTVVLGCLAGACIMRRSAFLEAGGYQPRFFIGREEALLALDLVASGWTMAYMPAAVVHHHPSPARDIDARHELLLRNALWCAWLRRPWQSAARETLRLLGTAFHEPHRMRGAAAALLGVPWVLRHRRVVPPPVEYALRRVHHD
jgi:GT2 family glycosyltransferase